jgi:acyl transferase domain-containing protein
MFANDGRCKTFDGSANGYARGEGGGAAVITRKRTPEDAFTLFCGSSVNHNGRSATMTAPHGPQQQALIR